MSPEPYRLEGSPSKEKLLAHVQSTITPNIQGWQWLYENLEDSDSRFMLLTVVAYRTIGWRLVRMPLDSEPFWSCLQRLAELENAALARMQTFHGARLSEMSLASVGFDMTVISDAFGVFNEFVYSQYAYRGRHGVVKPSNGDYVLDCGACFGGTSLFFADCVGAGGTVMSFEFLPSNLEVFNKNLKNNPKLAKRVRLVQAPVWSQDNYQLTIEEAGPATQVHAHSNLPGLQIASTTIDSAVKDLPKVDFIKMDIEGAEMEALCGARRTLERFRPNLAICVYHKLCDFYEIPIYLRDLNLGYRFFLQHSSIHGDETVLFALSD